MKLELVKTENFEEYPCDFYRDVNQDIYLNREQIGTALEYADPSKAIRKIHMAHKDRLEPLCVRVKIDGAPQIGATLTKREEQECVYYSERGIMEICRWSRQKKANQFMDWVDKEKAKLKKNDEIPQNSENTSLQTPIEIALQIDENGMTLASSLYSFLELEPKNFSRWCKKNIVDNIFAIENEDYRIFVFQEEKSNNKGRPKTDYKITSEFAKRLSMTGHTEKNEEARRYFIACEQGLKIAALKIKSMPNNETQILNSIDLLTQSMTTLTSTIANFQEQLHTLQEDVDYIKKVQEDRHMKRTKLPSSWYVSMVPKYKLLMEHFHCSRSKIYSSIYRKLETQYGIKIKDVYDDYCITNHLTHNDCYPMTAIEADENLQKIVSDIVNSEIIGLEILSEEELKNMDQDLFDRNAS